MSDFDLRVYGNSEAALEDVAIGVYSDVDEISVAE